MMRAMTRFFCLLSLLALLGCGDDDAPPADGGGGDAGTDSGLPPADGGDEDGGGPTCTPRDPSEIPEAGEGGPPRLAATTNWSRRNTDPRFQPRL